MARRSRSSITKLPTEARSYIEKLLREDRLSLDEMIDDIRRKFPTSTPSRSTLHRYQASIDEVIGRTRDIDAASRALVSELGENPDDKAGALLVHAVTTLAVHAAMNAQQNSELSIADVRKFAAAAKDTIAARSMSLRERQAIREEAAKQAGDAARDAGLSEDTVEKIRARVLKGAA
jgi:hypothetical protein